MRGTFTERFWDKVDTSGDCWMWTGFKNGQGYGRIYVPGTRNSMMPAHRASFLIHYGPFSRLDLVCHRCDNPSCVRPDHLFLGSTRDNAQDMSSKGRARGQDVTHCPQGHEYTPENTYVYEKPGRRRYCRACMRSRTAQRCDAAYWRSYRAKRREQGRVVGTKASDTDAERLSDWQREHEAGCG